MGLVRQLGSFYRLQLDLLWRWRPGRKALIRRIIVSLIVGTIALQLTVAILPGIHVDGFDVVVAAVILLALINAFVRSVVLLVFAAISTIAVIVATLLFQGMTFLIVDWLLPEFHVDGWVIAFIGALVFALFNTILSGILNVDRDQSFYGALVAQMARQRSDRIVTDSPGLVIIQIDGLAQPILAHQIRAGRVPFIARWVRSGEMTLDGWTALLPSQTSASQAGILHGNNSFIPAFRWWEKDRQRMLVSNHPADATEIVTRASNGEGLLSNDGASVGNLVSGDAVRSYITMATIRDPGQGLGHSRAWYSFFVSPDNYLRAAVLAVGEVIKEFYQASRSSRRGVDPSMHRGMPYPIARAATNVILRSLSTALVIEEIYRGTPVIYVDYTDYDEIAHHSGPERAETLDALDGVDDTIKTLAKVLPDAPRPYKFVLLSDHGQSLGATFLQRYGETLEAVISKLMGGADDVTAATGRVEEWGPLNAVVTEASRASGTTGAMTRMAFASRTDRGGAVDLAPTSEKATKAQTTEPPELVVCASGNLGLVYFPRLPGRVSMEDMDRHWPGLVGGLVEHPGVGLLMGHSTEKGTMVVGKSGVRYLANDTVVGTDPLIPYGKHAVTGLRRIDAMANCPDLTAISMLDTATDEVAAFEELIGSHGGLGGTQTEPFILHPSEWTIDEPLIGAEDVYRQIRVWLEDLGIRLGPQVKPAPVIVPAEVATKSGAESGAN